MATMYDIIKKQNGEHFAKAIRNYNNGIFEIPNLDKIVKYAGRDAEPIMNFLVSLLDIKIEEHTVHADPIKLLEMAGYNAFIADTLEKQNSIIGYYAPGEELCTFRDEDRYKRFHIIHAVKKNAKQIKRENFKNPDRQDEYGTSVISIQILKNGGFISIKNRYNHSVQNPDSTFNSNPDNIIPGLSDALKHYFNVDFASQKTTVPNGYMMFGGQIIKYNFELENTYIGDGFYIKNGSNKITLIDPSTQVQMDYFILDLKAKKLLNPSGIYDSFCDIFNEVLRGCKKLTIKKDADKQICIYLDGVCHARVKDGQITYVHLPNVTDLLSNFLHANEKLTEISLPNVETIGSGFLEKNKRLTELSLPKVKIIGAYCLYRNRILKKVSLPNVVKIDGFFLYSNNTLTEISLPNVKNIGEGFIYRNKCLASLSAPMLVKVGHDFLHYNTALTGVSLPKLTYIGHEFLHDNDVLTEISLPEVELIGDGFLYHNNKLREISLPNVKTIADWFLFNNTDLASVSLPKVERIGHDFLCYNKRVNKLLLPKIEKIGNNFFLIEDKTTINDIIDDKKYTRSLLREKFINGIHRIHDMAITLIKQINERE